MRKRIVFSAIAAVITALSFMLFSGCTVKNPEEKPPVTSQESMQTAPESTSAKKDEPMLNFRFCDAKDYDIDGDAVPEACRIDIAELDGGDYAMRFSAIKSDSSLSSYVYYNIFRVPTDELRLVIRDNALCLLFTGEKDDGLYFIIPGLSGVSVTDESGKEALPYFGTQTMPTATSDQ